MLSHFVKVCLVTAAIGTVVAISAQSSANTPTVFEHRIPTTGTGTSRLRAQIAQAATIGPHSQATPYPVLMGVIAPRDSVSAEGSASPAAQTSTSAASGAETVDMRPKSVKRILPVCDHDVVFDASCTNALSRAMYEGHIVPPTDAKCEATIELALQYQKLCNK